MIIDGCYRHDLFWLPFTIVQASNYETFEWYAKGDGPGLIRTTLMKGKKITIMHSYYNNNSDICCVVMYGFAVQPGYRRLSKGRCVIRRCPSHLPAHFPL